jgi:tetratricopeptide (TPR) repeat protein
MKRTPCIIFALLVTAVVPDAAQASEEESIEIAKEFMELGQALYAAGKFEEAAEAFLNAYKTQPFAAFLFNTGVSYEKAEMWAEAVENFQRYLDEEPKASDRKDVEARIEALKAHVGKGGEGGSTFIIEKKCGGEGQPPCEGEAAPPATPDVAMKSIVQVRTKPEGAKVVFMDPEGNDLFTSVSPAQQTLEPGKYELRVEHPEFQKAFTPLSVSEGRVYVVVVELSQGTFLGYLSVKSNVQGAEVYLDDREAGSVGGTPWGNPVPTGDHTVWIEHPGYESIEKEVTLGVGDTLEIDAQLDRVEHGELEVVTNVDHATLSVDGKIDPGSLPLVLQFPAGTHQVLVEAKGLKPYVEDVELQAGQRTKILVRLNPKPKRTPAYISFGLAVAFFSAGIAFAVKSKQLKDDMQMDLKSGFLDNNDPRQHQLLGWNIGADTSFLLGGIMSIMGIVYMLRDPLPDSEGKVKDPVEFADLPEYSK